MTIKVVCTYCRAFIRDKETPHEDAVGSAYGTCAICRTLPDTEQRRIHEQTLEMEAARRSAADSIWKNQP